MFKKILFPVDLSESSEPIVPYVTAMAEKFQSEIHLIFVAREFQQYYNLGVAMPAISELEESLITGARVNLREFSDRHFQKFHVRVEVLQGHPAEMIVRYAEEEKIDLVIIGTHGRRGIERIIFGSVAEHVVKHSPAPVFTIKPFKPSVGNETKA